MPLTREPPRLAIIGAGPIGLEAALAARQLGLEVTLYERGRLGEHLLRWGHVRLFTPFGMNSTPAGRAAILKANPSHAFPADAECLTGRQHVGIYLEPLARLPLFDGCIETETQVVRIARRGFLKEDSPGDAKRGRQPFLLLLNKKGKERVAEADVVLDCSGTYGQHRWMGEGGMPAVGELAVETQIGYALDDILGDRRNHYAGKTTLVVGGGYSAATSVCSLAALAEQAPDTWVIWLARTANTQPLRRVPSDPLRERDKLAVRANTLATRSDGNVEFHGQAHVLAVEPIDKDRGFRVVARLGRHERSWEVERVVANVGYSPDTTMYRELQVHECYASLGPMKLAAAVLGSGGGDCLRQTGHGPESLRNPEPNFYILGAKSYGRNAEFLLRIGFQQVQDVFSLIKKDFGL